MCTDTRTRTRPKHSDLSALHGATQPPTGSPGFPGGQPAALPGSGLSSQQLHVAGVQLGAQLSPIPCIKGGRTDGVQERVQMFGGGVVVYLGAPQACWSSGFQSCYSLEALPHYSLGPPISSNLPTSPSSFPMSCLGALVGSASVFLLERHRLACGPGSVDSWFDSLFASSSLLDPHGQVCVPHNPLSYA